jgi:ankyrin repeat protein
MDIFESVFADRVHDLEVYLENGGDPNVRDIDGHTLLHFCCIAHSVKCAKILLDRKDVDPEVRDNYGYSPIFAAYARSFHEDNQVITMMVMKGIGLNDHHNETTLLHYFAYYGHIAYVRHYLSLDADPDVQDANGDTPLHGAFASGYMNVADLLIREGADVYIKNNDGDTPIDILRLEYPELVPRILENYEKVLSLKIKCPEDF